VDLGDRTTKAVLWNGAANYCAHPLRAARHAIYEKKISAESLTDHLQSVAKALESETKLVTLAVGLDDTMVRQVELPQIPVDEMRLVLKNNTRVICSRTCRIMFLIATFSSKVTGQIRRCRQNGSIPN